MGWPPLAGSVTSGHLPWAVVRTEYVGCLAWPLACSACSVNAASLPPKCQARSGCSHAQARPGTPLQPEPTLCLGLQKGPWLTYPLCTQLWASQAHRVACLMRPGGSPACLCPQRSPASLLQPQKTSLLGWQASGEHCALSKPADGAVKGSELGQLWACLLQGA